MQHRMKCIHRESVHTSQMCALLFLWNRPCSIPHIYIYIYIYIYIGSLYITVVNVCVSCSIGVKKRRKRSPQHGSSSSKRQEPSIDLEESGVNY